MPKPIRARKIPTLNSPSDWDTNPDCVFISGSYPDVRSIILNNLKLYDKIDIKTNFSTFRMDELGRISVDGSWMFPSKLALGQIWNRMTHSVDMNYMFNISPDIRSINFNWWRNRIPPSRGSSKILVRTICDLNDRHIRAVLGPNYNIVDDIDILDMVVEALPIKTDLEAHPSPKAAMCKMTLDRYGFNYSCMVLPIVASEFTLKGLYEIRGDKYIGIVNSEVGKSSTMVAPVVTFNGISVLDDANTLIRTPHVGKAKKSLKESTSRLGDIYSALYEKIRFVSTLKLNWKAPAKELFNRGGIVAVTSFTSKVMTTLGLRYHGVHHHRSFPSDIYLSEMLSEIAYASVAIDSFHTTSNENCILNLTQSKIDSVINSIAKSLSKELKLL